MGCGEEAEEAVGVVVVEEEVVLTPLPVPILLPHAVVATTQVAPHGAGIALFKGLRRERVPNTIVLVHEVEGRDEIRRPSMAWGRLQERSSV